MKRLLLCSLFAVFSTMSFSQGCSDAGVCTMPSIAPLGEESSAFKIDFKASLEATEPGALLISPQFWLSYRINEKTTALLKVPFWFVNDPDWGSNYSLSDPIVSFGFDLHQTELISLTLVTGVRIGINNANAQGTNGSLPMDYQSSLGTTDLILGLNTKIKEYSASLAFQYPVWQYNQNQNIATKYLEDPAFDSIVFDYKRQPDLVLRIEREFKYNNWGWRLGLLPIFHLGDDVLDATSVNASVTIENSAGLTLNIPLGAWYSHNNWTFGLDVGFPVVTRQERPDGLTRKYVVQPRIAYNFD